MKDRLNYQKDADLKRLILIIFVFFLVHACNLNAKITSSGLYYSEGGEKIKTKDGRYYLTFINKYESLASYYFDEFDNMPAIVHNSHSLDTYTTYSQIQKYNNDFLIDCVYVNFRNGKNGVVSNDGRCGLGIKIKNKSKLTGMEGVGITNKLIGRVDAFSTEYLFSVNPNVLAIIDYNSKEKYIYKLYDNKEKMFDGVYKIVSCGKENDYCEVYDENTWVVINEKNMSVKFKELSKAKPLMLKEITEKKMVKKTDIAQPIRIIADKTYMYTYGGEKLNSYLIKGDLVTLLYFDKRAGFCYVRYINDDNNYVDRKVICKDLSVVFS